MLNEAEIIAVARHKVSHDVGYCTCPCFDALMKVGEAIKRENGLRLAVAKISPDVLAALTIGAAGGDEPEDAYVELLGGDRRVEDGEPV